MWWKYELGWLDNFNCIGLVWGVPPMGRCICRRECSAAGLTMLEELWIHVGLGSIIPLSTSALMVSIESLQNQQAMKVTLFFSFFFLFRRCFKTAILFSISLACSFLLQTCIAIVVLINFCYQVIYASKDNVTFLSQLDCLVLCTPKPKPILSSAYICEEFIYMCRIVACKLSCLCTSL